MYNIILLILITNSIPTVPNIIVNRPTAFPNIGTLIVPTKPVLISPLVWTHIVHMQFNCVNKTEFNSLMSASSVQLHTMGELLVSYEKYIATVKVHSMHNGSNGDIMMAKIKSMIETIKSSVLSQESTVLKLKEIFGDIFSHSYTLGNYFPAGVCKAEKKKKVIKRSVEPFNVFTGNTMHGAVFNFEGKRHESTSVPTPNPVQDDSINDINDFIYVTPDKKRQYNDEPVKPVYKGPPDYSAFSDVQRKQQLLKNSIKSSRSVTQPPDFGVRRAAAFDRFMSLYPYVDFSRCVYNGYGAAKCPEHITVKPILKRTKRGLFNFVGTAQNWLWGTATDDQISVVNETMHILEQQIKLNQNQTNFLQDTMVSMASTLNDQLDNVTLAFSKKMRKFANITRKVASDVSGLDMKINNVEKIQLSLLGLQQIQAQTTMWNTVYIDLLTSANIIQSFFDGLTLMVQSGQPNPNIIPFDFFNKLNNEITNKLPKRYQVAQSDNLLDYFRTEVIKIRKNPSGLHLIISIPIIESTLKSSAFRVQSIPIRLGGSIVQFEESDTIVQLINHDEAYLNIDPLSYANCIKMPFTICEMRLAAHVLRPQTCIHDLIIGNTNNPAWCKLKMKEKRGNIHTNALLLDQDKWYVSLENDTLLGSYKCARGGGADVVDTLIVPDQSIVTIPNECSLSIGDLYLYSQSTMGVGVSSSTLNMSQAIAIPQVSSISPLSNIQISKLFQVETRDKRSTPVTTDDDILFRHDSEPLMAIQKMLTEKKQLYLTTQDKLSHEFSESITKLGNHTSNWSLDWFQLPSLGSSISIGISCLALFISIVAIVSRRSPAAFPLLPLLDKVPGSWSLPILKTNWTIKSVPEQIDLFPVHPIIEHYHQFHAIYQILAICIMVLIMIICSCRLHTSLDSRMTRYQNKCGIYPQNNHVLHNEGESKVIAFILVECKHWLRSKSFKFVGGFQVATLPFAASRWGIKPNPNPSRWLLTQHQRYRFGKLKIPLTWGPICLALKEDIDFETCADMPKYLRLTKNQIIFQNESIPSWLISDIRMISLIRLIITDQTSSHELYHEGLEQ